MNPKWEKKWLEIVFSSKPSKKLWPERSHRSSESVSVSLVQKLKLFHQKWPTNSRQWGLKSVFILHQPYKRLRTDHNGSERFFRAWHFLHVRANCFFSISFSILNRLINCHLSIWFKAFRGSLCNLAVELTFYFVVIFSVFPFLIEMLPHVPKDTVRWFIGLSKITHFVHPRRVHAME